MFSDRFVVLRRLIIVLTALSFWVSPCSVFADIEPDADMYPLLPLADGTVNVTPPQGLNPDEIIECQDLRKTISAVQLQYALILREGLILANHVSTLNKQLREAQKKQAECSTIYFPSAEDKQVCKSLSKTIVTVRADLSFYTAMWIKINELILSIEDELREYMKALDQLNCQGELA